MVKLILYPLPLIYDTVANIMIALGKIGEGIAKRGRIFAKNRRQGRLSAADDGFGVGEVRFFLLKIQRKGVSLQIN